MCRVHTYALGFTALIQGALTRSRSVGGRLIDATLAAAFVAHLYLQAAWYCWWLGTGTFGMRGMAVTGVYLVPALVRWGHQLAGRKQTLFIVAAALASLYSSVLLWQQESNFLTATALVHGLAQQVSDVRFAAPIVVAAIGGLVVALWLRARQQSGFLLVSVGAALSGIVFVYLGRAVAIESAVVSLALLGVVAMMSALAVGFWLAADKEPTGESECVESVWLDAARWTVVAVFIGTALLFARLTRNTEAYLASGLPSPRMYTSVGSFHRGEVEATYGEYMHVRGFVDEKE